MRFMSKSKQQREEPLILTNDDDDMDEDSSYGPAPPPPPVCSDDEMPAKDDPPPSFDQSDEAEYADRVMSFETEEDAHTYEDEYDQPSTVAASPTRSSRNGYEDGEETDYDDEESMEIPPTSIVQRMVESESRTSSVKRNLPLALICMTACCLILLATILGIGFGTGLFLRNGVDKNGSLPTSSQTFNSERADAIRGIVQSQSVAPLEHHFDTASAESKAVHWLGTEPAFAHVDPANAVDQQRLSQLYGLATLFYSSSQPWTNDEGWLQTDDECTWYGVTCDVAQLESGESMNVVTGLSLLDNNMGGTIPSDITMLKYLYDLDLSGNGMVQDIGDIDWSVMGGMTSLYLGGNEFFGDLAALNAIGESLQVLRIPENAFEGDLPDLRELAGLRELDVEANRFSGQIPNTLAALDLEVLRLGYNNWDESEIPPFLYTMRTLQELSLRRSNLFGNLQGAIGSLQGLSVLLLEDNTLSGVIPNALFRNAPALYRVAFSGNNFFGPIPDLSNVPLLAYLDLTANALTGKIPALRNNAEMVSLRLGDNVLTGQLPDGLTELLQLEVLDLSRNNLSDQLPVNIGALFNLRTLNLAANLKPEGTGFYGALPNSLGNLRNLRRLEIRSNLFTGDLPTTMDNLDSILRVDVRFNMLNGIIPPNVAAAWSDTLEEGYFSSTQMSGPVPDEICGENLRVLNAQCDWECSCCTMEC